ncbi:MAG: hypothetical protein A4E74_02250 [Syntrophus sp. PtaB.Bin075]|nr:MAG: hypothetical protein A4E74_02250 [Syntrophus sp. PtaB.Bin075]
MRKVKFCFLAIVIVFMSASLSYAQPNTLPTPKDRGITTKQLNNTPLKPEQSQRGTKIKVPDAVNIGVITLKSLSVGRDDSGSNGRRLCPLTISNMSANSLSNNYMMKYWWRAGSSEPWDHYYGCTMQWSIPARRTKTIDLHVSIPSGATEFRVTLHESRTSPTIIAEISAPVP